MPADSLEEDKNIMLSYKLEKANIIYTSFLCSRLHEIDISCCSVALHVSTYVWILHTDPGFSLTKIILEPPDSNAIHYLLIPQECFKMQHKKQK